MQVSKICLQSESTALEAVTSIIFTAQAYVRVAHAQVDAMELKNQGPELAAVLRDMGVNYNPRRLANALKGRELEVSARAVRVTYTLGRFIASLAKVH